MTTPIKVISLCIAALAVLFASSDPGHLPSAALVVPFALIFIVLFVGLSSLIGHTLSVQKRLRVALLGATLPTLLLVLQSLGQLTVRDMFTAMALFCIAYFYLSRTMRSADGLNNRG